MEQEKHSSLLKIEHSIIALLDANQNLSLLENPELGQLLAERKNLINSRFKFTEENIKEIARVNERIANIENMTESRARDYSNLLSLRKTQQVNFEASAYLYLIRNFEKSTPISYKMANALDEYCKILIYSCLYDAEDNKIYPLRQPYLGNPAIDKNPEWNKYTSIPELSKIAFCTGWNMLNEQTYYSLTDMMSIKEFTIEVLEYHV